MEAAPTPAPAAPSTPAQTPLAAAPVPTPTQAMDVVAPPVAAAPKAEDTTTPPSEMPSPKPAEKPAPAKIAKAPKTASNGVTVAIFATVIIVLGLAALAVAAYLKTKK